MTLTRGRKKIGKIHCKDAENIVCLPIETEALKMLKTKEALKIHIFSSIHFKRSYCIE